MASIEQLLQRGEIVHFKARPHGVVFWRATAWIAVAAALFIVAPLGGQLRLWALAGCLFAGAAAAAAIEAALHRATTELVVTDRRLLLLTGRLGESIYEVFGPAIAGLEIGHDALSRRLGFAWFRIPGLGRDASRLPLAQPELLRTRIEALALGRRAEPAPAAAKLEPEPEAKPEALKAVGPSLREELAVLNEELDAIPRRQQNGDARPKANGDGRLGLRPQPDLDRI